MTEIGNRRRWWIFALVAAVLLAGLGAWALRPAYRGYKERRSLTLAQSFLAAGDLRSALLSLRQTLTLNPSNLAAAKLMADFATQTQSPAALGWWLRVVEIEPSLEHQALLASAALRVEGPPFPVAAKSVATLAATAETNVVYHLLASQLALKLNQGAAAEQHLEAAARLEPTNQLHAVNLAMLRLNSRRPEVAAAARGELRRLEADPLWGMTVLRALATDALNRTNGAAALQYTTALVAGTNATFGDRLQHLTAVRLAQPDGVSELLALEQQRCGTNLVLIAQLGLWQNQAGRGAETLRWFGGLPAGVREVPPLALVEADALLALPDWPGLEARLTPQRWEEQEFMRLAYLSRALREQGRATLARANWERAVGASLLRMQNAGALAQVAFNWRWQDEGLDLLWQAARRWEREEWPLQNLMRLYANAADSDGLFRVYELIYSRQPEVLPAKNNFVMLGLLLQREPARMLQLAEELNQAGGTNGIFASTYALALHRDGRTAAGLEVLRGLSAPERTRSEVRPYEALLLAAMGRRAEVAAELQAAAAQAALPEERELFLAALR